MSEKRPSPPPRPDRSRHAGRSRAGSPRPTSASAPPQASPTGKPQSTHQSTQQPVVTTAPGGGTWARVDTATPNSRQAAPRRSAVALADPSAIDTVIEKARERLVGTTARNKDERERERRDAQRRLWFRVWGKRLGVVAAVATLAWVALLSPVFAMDPAKVEVSGYGTVVDPTAVRAAVAEFDGTALAVLNTGRVSHELKNILGVREAHVERSWPNGLVITIDSREPVAAVPDPSGGFTYVDNEGIQVGRTTDKPSDLPILGIPHGDVRVLESALGVIAAMPEDLRERIASLNAATEDSVTFKLREGPTVEWGSAEQSPLKVEVLQVLLESKAASKADTIDVSAPTLPITKN